ncbi:MAG: alpha/beta fold hydrolase [Nocardiopsaceae bacterium]|nr:alpha/beta fold hydrolase [Nocardiopsaceae bacterium]
MPPRIVPQTVSSLDRAIGQHRRAVANLFDFVVRGGLADRQRMPSTVIDTGRVRTVHRYLPLDAVPAAGRPVLLVPALGAQAAAFDLRRGNSLVEHLLSTGRPAYLVDYGPIGWADRDLGFEFWINEVLPRAIAAVSADAGGEPVHLAGWCMGGLIALGAVAIDPALPVSSVAMIGSPFDLSKHPVLVPVQKVAGLTRGHVLGTAFRVLGGAPGWLLSPAFKATSPRTYLKKPLTLLKYRDDRDFLAHVEAVDELMNSMYAYPGRATLQFYHRLAVRNELASGTIQGPNTEVRLADVRVPVMNVAGQADALVPVAVAHHVGDLLPNAPQVRLEIAPGGHLGVLTGRSAATSTWPMLDDFFAQHDAGGGGT